jgi:hypothetical protein
MAVEIFKIPYQSRALTPGSPAIPNIRDRTDLLIYGKTVKITRKQGSFRPAAAPRRPAPPGRRENAPEPTAIPG